MTIEIYKPDLKVLNTHTTMAVASGSIVVTDFDETYFEYEAKYIEVQIPHLYQYFFVDKGEGLTNHGARSYSGGGPLNPIDPVTKEIALPNDVAEKYYWLQHRYGRLWVMNALLNIYSHRQEAIERRHKVEQENRGYEFLIPFREKDWPYMPLPVLEGSGSAKKKFYHIDANYPILDTIKDYQELACLKSDTK